MFALLLQVIGLGIASSMSPVVFGVALSVLSSKESALSKTLAYLAGGIATAALLFLFGALVGGHVVGNPSPQEVALIDLLLGVVFLLMAGIAFFRRKKASGVQPSAKPKKTGLGNWFLIGFLLNSTNFDAELLFFTEAREITQSSVLASEKIVLASIGALFFLSPVLVPLLAHLLFPKKFKKLLSPVSRGMEEYGGVLAAIIFLVFGAYFVWRGLLLLGLF